MATMAQLQMAVVMLAVFTAGLAFLLVREERRLTRKTDVLERHVGTLMVWQDKTKQGRVELPDDEIPF